MEYLQWLIYSDPFKSPDQGVPRDEHNKYYDTWVVMFKSRWGPYRNSVRKLLLKELETWTTSTRWVRQGVVASVSCRVKKQLSFPWMKSFLWNLDPTTREVQRPRPCRRATAALDSKSVRL